ncbi:MAG: CsgG/HfaB family protein [Cyanobacteriota bacterium]
MKTKALHYIALLLLTFVLLTSIIPSKTYADQGTITFNSGVAELSLKNYDKALEYFQRTLQANPYHVKAYNNMGIALQKKGDYNNAIVAYQQALKLDPRYGNAYYNLGLCLKDMGRAVEAIEALQAFVNFNPNDSDAVRAKWIANDLRETLDNVDEATRKYYLGSWLISDLNYKDAIDPLRTALANNPNDIKINYALGLALKRTNDYNGAIEQFNSILQQNNQNALAYYELGECYENLGNVGAAAQSWQNYANLAPYSPSADALKSRLASAQQQQMASQQQNFYQNQLAQNNPMGVSSPMQNQPSMQQTAYQPDQTYTNQPQQIAQYNTPIDQGSIPGVSGAVPGITAPPTYISQSMPSVVPQFNPTTSYGASFSGPTPGTTAARTGKTRIAVLDFDYSAVRPWWSGQWDIGKGVASLIQGELVRSGAYSVIERTALDQILHEQKLSQSSLFDTTTAASVGKLLGVDILVLGNITQFGIENKKGGIGAAIPFVSLATSIQSKKSVASVAFDMRMVSVDTGEILEVASVLGKSKRRGLLIDFSKSGNAGALDFSSSNFQDSVLGEASTAASQKATEIINTHYEKVTRATIDSTSQDVGVVAYVGAQGVIINAGSAAGLKIGNRLSIERLTDVVKDPISGKIIKALTAPIGEMEIKEIEAGSSTGTMVSGGAPQVGDLVRYKADMNVVVPPTGAETSVTAEIMYKKKKNK